MTGPSTAALQRVTYPRWLCYPEHKAGPRTAVWWCLAVMLPGGPSGSLLPAARAGLPMTPSGRSAHPSPLPTHSCCSSHEEAIGRGHLTCFKFLHYEGRELTASFHRLAVQRERRDILLAARDLGCSWDVETSCHPAYQGNLESSNRLQSQGKSHIAKACEVAAAAGNLSGLNGCKRVVNLGVERFW